MNLIETLVSKAAEEACELGKALLKLNSAGIKATDSESGEPLVLDAIKQLNEILACVELLRDRGIPLAGIGDPVAIGEAKGAIVQDMEEAMKNGTLVLSEDDQNPRPEGVNDASNGMPEDGAGGDGDQGNGDDQNLGADGTDPSGADGTADDTGTGDGSDDLGDNAGGGDDSGDEEGSGDDTSGDDTGTGDDVGDDDLEEEESEDDESEEDDDSSEEEEEEEPGTNDV
jgi:hypothetical protein